MFVFWMTLFCMAMVVTGLVLHNVSIGNIRYQKLFSWNNRNEAYHNEKNTVSRRRKKGQKGEDEVEEQLSLLDPSEYKVINNGLFRLKGDITVQIDHIVISRTGIYVVETKNYGGKVYQNSGDNWVQVWGRGRFPFYSPLKQNESHVKSLMYILFTKRRELFKPVIAFPNRTEIKVLNGTIAVQMSDICAAIEEEDLHILSEEEVLKFYNTLMERNIYSKKNIRKHRKRVKTIYG